MRSQPQVTMVIPMRACRRPAWKGLIPLLEAAEIEARPGGDDDHGGDADFEERGVVGDERVRLRGREDVIGCRGGGHRVRISRLQAWRRGGWRCLAAIRLALHESAER